MRRPHSVYCVTCVRCGAEIASPKPEAVCVCGLIVRMMWGQFLTVTEPQGK